MSIWATTGSKLPIWPKRRSFGETSLKKFSMAYCPLSSFEKKSSEQILRYNLLNIGPQLGQNCPLDAKEKFFGNFSYVIFVNFLTPTMLQCLKKIFTTDPEICLHNFRPQLGQNCQFGPKEDLLKSLTLK